MDPQQRDQDLLELIIELIGHLERRLRNTDRAKFLKDRDERDLAAFRLAHVGEAVGKISNELKNRHPELPWAAMVAMRNLISHDYVAVDAARLWKTATEDLRRLDEVCRSELKRVR